jgi:hypothetical protein
MFHHSLIETMLSRAVIVLKQQKGRKKDVDDCRVGFCELN